MFDPNVCKKEVQSVYGISLCDYPKNYNFELIILAVEHTSFFELGSKQIRKFGKREKHILFDVKSIFPKKESDLQL